MKKLSRKKIEEFTKKYGEPIGYKKGIPILKALPREDFLFGWRIFCVYCKKFHNHGQMKKNLEHRVSHCNSDSPYVLAGYYLQQIEDEKQKMA